MIALTHVIDMIGDWRCTAWVVYRHAAALFYVPIRPVTLADRGGAMSNGFTYSTLLGIVRRCQNTRK